VDAGQLDQVVRLAEAIDTFGALVIGLAAAFIIGFTAVFIIFSRNKKMTSDKDTDFSRLFSDMQEQNQAVFKELMQATFKANQPELVSESITATVAVQEQLKQVAAVTKADRVSVYAFHNGQRMMNGRHMIKFSCWAEFVMLSRYVQSDKHRDIQVSRIQDICDALIKDHHWEALTEEEVQKTQLGVWEEAKEIKSAFAQAIYSADGAPIGFVFLEYLLAPIEPSWVERARDEVKKLSDKVSLVLDIELN